MFSGGIGSWAAAKRVAEAHGTESLTLLFTDTLIEDEDLYRFLEQAAANVGGKLVRLAEGRTPWQVFHDVRYMGNSRVDPCSRVLKREMSDAWLKQHCDPTDTMVYVGIDWSEKHRIDRLAVRRAKEGWRYEAPMCDAPYLTKPMMLGWLKREGIEPPRLYAMGFAHNNCGGFCVKAGLGHFARLYAAMPDRYRHHEQQEQDLRDHLGRQDITVVRDWATRPPINITLRELRERMDAGQQPDLLDIGGCGCFVDEETDGNQAATESSVLNRGSAAP
jgi:hypothetical protein